MNQARVPFVRNGLVPNCGSDEWSVDDMTDCLKGFKILDVGCGAGILSEALAKCGAEVVGIDPSELLISAARDHRKPDMSVNYLCELIQDHVVENSGVYDAVVASEVVEHIADKDSFLKSCVAALKPGGSIFITTFNKNWWSWVAAIIFAEYILGLLPKHTHAYDQFITPQDLSDLLTKLNCRPTQVVGFRYNFIRRKCEFQSSTSISYGLHAIKQCSKQIN